MREDDAQTPSGDQGQALRAKQSSVDALSGLGTKEVPWDGRESQAQSISGCFRAQRNPSASFT